MAKIQNARQRITYQTHKQHKQLKHKWGTKAHHYSLPMNLLKYVTGYLMGSGGNESLVQISGSLYDRYKGNWRCLYVSLIRFLIITLCTHRHTCTRTYVHMYICNIILAHFPLVIQSFVYHIDINIMYLHTYCHTTHTYLPHSSLSRSFFQTLSHIIHYYSVMENS